ncbi:hypothetical protein E2C01_080885 [Portunus trituberculatus]|uniref:Uncharacterized protein n=1 Tax=Portunus trituberculatus TaxID=210409 RepID=A0A5B7IUK5_PORTR|nr:hypothetical protein [Portunus trituberculatus]
MTSHTAGSTQSQRRLHTPHVAAAAGSGAGRDWGGACKELRKHGKSWEGLKRGLHGLGGARNNWGWLD